MLIEIERSRIDIKIDPRRRTIFDFESHSASLNFNILKASKYIVNIVDRHARAPRPANNNSPLNQIGARGYTLERTQLYIISHVNVKDTLI